jgi:hypothetical protein
MQITIIAIIRTKRAATTGTTKFKFAKIMRIASSAVNSGIPLLLGAIVAETTNNKKCS